MSAKISIRFSKFSACSFSFFLNAKRRENEPKERKTKSKRVDTVRGKAPEPLLLNAAYSTVTDLARFLG